MKCRIGGILSSSSVLAGLALILSPVRPMQGAGWVTNGPMNTARYHHTATLFSSGKVLVTGGYDDFGSSLASAELFDPATGIWATAGGMSDARSGQTATLLPTGQVLVAGGYGFYFGVSYSILASVELFNPATGTWTTNNPMADARVGHTATLLPNGKVLVTGGAGNDSPYYLSGAELFDPAAGTWEKTGSLNVARAWHTATLLPDGQVLVAGGQGTNGPLSSAELYEPSNETWTIITNSLNNERLLHTATLLPNGQVLVAGGFGNAGVLSSGELFDPHIGTWTPTSNPLNFARGEHTATLLPNGQVLVAGGYSAGSYSGALSSAELYDPTTGIWTATNDLTFARGDHTATVLPGGKLLIAGGYFDPIGFLSSTEVYDPAINPATGAWTNANAMNTRRSYHTATLLPDGKVLVAGGGGDSASAETYNPADGTWTNVGALKAARGGHTATLLPNGKVLIVGGFESSGVGIATLASAELYNPDSGAWRFTGTMTVARAYHTATLLPNGRVLVAGGRAGDTFLNSAEIYDPASEIWMSVAPMTTNRAWHTATLLASGRVLVSGGLYGGPTNFGTAGTAELFDPASGVWMAAATMTEPRAHHTATLLPNGKVLVAGGDGMFSTSPTGSAGMKWSSAELFDPVTGMWTATGSMSIYRDYHTATLLPNGKVLIAGNVDYSSGSELFDPVAGRWSASGDTAVARFDQTATLLPDGGVLISGGMYPGGGNYYSSVEIYDVGLGYSNSWKPQITSVTSPVNLGGSLVVTGAQFRGVSEGSSGNTQDSSTDYPLVQLRSIESGQTVFLSSTNWGTNSFASLPVWNFPPGYALATVFVNGIQSMSSILNIIVPVPTPTVLACTAPTNGAFQFCFTNNPGALFGVLTTTNLALPLANWTRLSGITEIGPGHFQFSDPQTTNEAQRFYSLFVP